jgi:hypothetical protein
MSSQQEVDTDLPPSKPAPYPTTDFSRTSLSSPPETSSQDTSSLLPTSPSTPPIFPPQTRSDASLTSGDEFVSDTGGGGGGISLFTSQPHVESMEQQTPSNSPFVLSPTVQVLPTIPMISHRSESELVSPTQFVSTSQELSVVSHEAECQISGDVVQPRDGGDVESEYIQTNPFHVLETSSWSSPISLKPTGRSPLMPSNSLSGGYGSTVSVSSVCLTPPCQPHVEFSEEVI